jgi:uncharacterized glyoxalase superfamily protein PhnB
MRFMVLIKADKNTEAGKMPSEQLLADMGRFNEELVKAGVMLAGEGLHPSAKGARVRFRGKERTVVDGPFAETKELIAGFWLWQVKSKEEAIEWVKRCPNPLEGEAQIEIRQVFEAEDFGAEFTPELREQEQRLRSQIESRAGAAPGGKVVAVPPSRGATPYLVIKGASDAIAFYQRQLGAELIFRLDDPTGAVMHAEMQIGPARFMLTEERPQYGALSPKTIGGSASTAIVYVPKVDDVVERAVKAGATVTMPVGDQFWGDRAGEITDPFGHKWMVATHIEDPSPEEVERRAKAMFASGGNS